MQHNNNDAMNIHDSFSRPFVRVRRRGIDADCSALDYGPDSDRRSSVRRSFLLGTRSVRPDRYDDRIAGDLNFSEINKNQIGAYYD